MTAPSKRLRARREARHRAKRRSLISTVPVLITRTGTVHYGVIDFTLCGVWIGPAEFGDFRVTCGNCRRAAGEE